MSEKTYTLFIPVGTTSIYNGEIGKLPESGGGEADNKELLEMAADYRDDADKNPKLYTRLFDKLVEAHSRFWGLNDALTCRKENYAKSSAELTSTRLFLDYMEELPPKDEDFEERALGKVVLLASAGNEGRFAAEVVETVMKMPNYRLPGTGVTVEIKAIPGLDVEFVDLGKVLPPLVDQFRPNSKEECAYFNVTGGYKATVALIGFLAKEKRYRMFYVHESIETPILLNEQTGRMKEAKRRRHAW